MANAFAQALHKSAEEEFPIIKVTGKSSWEKCLDETVELSPQFERLCGIPSLPLLSYLKVKAENEGTSYVHSVVHEFLNRRYKLKKLRVEFTGPVGRDWGTAIWYPHHPIYKIPFESDMFGKPKDRRIIPEFWHAMFKTERAGDQRFCLYSIEMFECPEILFHRTIIYKSITFSPPPNVKRRKRRA